MSELRRIPDSIKPRLFLVGERPPAVRGSNRAPFEGRSGIFLGKVLDAYYPDLLACRCCYLYEEGLGPWSSHEAWNGYLRIIQEVEEVRGLLFLFGRRAMQTATNAPGFFASIRGVKGERVASLPNLSARNRMWNLPDIKEQTRTFFWRLVEAHFGKSRI